MIRVVTRSAMGLIHRLPRQPMTRIPWLAAQTNRIEAINRSR